MLGKFWLYAFAYIGMCMLAHTWAPSLELPTPKSYAKVGIGERDWALGILCLNLPVHIQIFLVRDL